jgi:hypothetical protein
MEHFKNSSLTTRSSPSSKWLHGHRHHSVCRCTWMHTNTHAGHWVNNPNQILPFLRIVGCILTHVQTIWTRFFLSSESWYTLWHVCGHLSEQPEPGSSFPQNHDTHTGTCADTWVNNPNQVLPFLRIMTHQVLSFLRIITCTHTKMCADSSSESWHAAWQVIELELGPSFLPQLLQTHRTKSFHSSDGLHVSSFAYWGKDMNCKHCMQARVWYT